MATVNLLSDTQTKPTPEMRRAMAEAEVGDEQRFEDPTVNALCVYVAELLGFEAAIFLPSGTMCNEIAFRVHIRPGGDAIFMHPSSHPYMYEAGGPAALSGAMTFAVDGPNGMFDGNSLSEALNYPLDRYHPRPRVVSIEQTANLGGGRIWPLEQVREVVEVAKAHSLLLHLDGARLMNAVVASGIAANEWTKGFDTAFIDFSKGLGAPVGGCLAGSAELIEEAWRYKQMLGGGMRQAGIIAAGALWALEHHVDRLAEDHENAHALAHGLATIPGIKINPDDVETNIVFFEVPDATTFCTLLEAQDVRMTPVSDRRIRAVTHLDVKAQGVERAVEVARQVMNS